MVCLQNLLKHFCVVYTYIVETVSSVVRKKCIRMDFLQQCFSITLSGPELGWR